MILTRTRFHLPAVLLTKILSSVQECGKTTKQGMDSAVYGAGKPLL